MELNKYKYHDGVPSPYPANSTQNMPRVQRFAGGSGEVQNGLAPLYCPAALSPAKLATTEERLLTGLGGRPIRSRP